jgi:hypothetical protein
VQRPRRKRRQRAKAASESWPFQRRCGQFGILNGASYFSVFGSPAGTSGSGASFTVRDTTNGSGTIIMFTRTPEMKLQPREGRPGNRERIIEGWDVSCAAAFENLPFNQHNRRQLSADRQLQAVSSFSRSLFRCTLLHSTSELGPEPALVFLLVGWIHLQPS